MIVQIYGIVTEKDAVSCVKAGVDHIGLVLFDSIKKDHIDIETAKKIVLAIDGRAKITAIFDLKPISEDELIEAATEIGCDIIHLAGSVVTNKEFFAKVKKRLPNVGIMQAVGVVDQSSVDYAINLSDYSDMLLLDTVKKGSEGQGIGAAGTVHDWNISRKIVEAVSVPVILAGGLGPDNVADAIRKVRPYGVDSLTKTNIEIDGKFVSKDIHKVKEFCRIAHQNL
ncbi:MAG: phosphoribosylanthranilate isomerase [Ruminococcaceae bacterium]|nr:phosphoribosylanthranilate isomerase [Oscillospiraceae bacterium]